MRNGTKLISQPLPAMRHIRIPSQLCVCVCGAQWTPAMMPTKLRTCRLEIKLARSRACDHQCWAGKNRSSESGKRPPTTMRKRLVSSWIWRKDSLERVEIVVAEAGWQWAREARKKKGSRRRFDCIAQLTLIFASLQFSF